MKFSLHTILAHKRTDIKHIPNFRFNEQKKYCKTIFFLLILALSTIQLLLTKNREHEKTITFFPSIGTWNYGFCSKPKHSGL